MQLYMKYQTRRWPSPVYKDSHKDENIIYDNKKWLYGLKNPTYVGRIWKKYIMPYVQSSSNETEPSKSATRAANS